MKEITSLSHPLVKHLVKLRKERSYRYEQGVVLVQGKKMVQELKPKTVLTALDDPSIEADEVILVSQAIIDKVSSMDNPEGVVAEVPMQQLSLEGATKLLVLDGINDPGNLGGLLRTALALGWSGAYLINGCCDPYNDKALSAARGATFKLPWKFGDWNELGQLRSQLNLEAFVADLEGEDVSTIDSDKLLLVLGNEANGPSDESCKQCQAITIPIGEGMESLNVGVAGGIMMYVL